MEERPVKTWFITGASKGFGREWTEAAGTENTDDAAGPAGGAPGGSRPEARRSVRDRATREAIFALFPYPDRLRAAIAPLRALQRTDIGEAFEPFSAGQAGSSAMPHKRNPELAERVCGLARFIRSATVPAMENVALWHERDISHSSVERYIGPDATVTLDFALARLTGVMDKLVVYPERMQANLERMGGLVHSQRVLLALVQKGWKREDAYRLVQAHAMNAWQNDVSFRALVEADREIESALSSEELAESFDPKYYIREQRTLFKRAGL